MTTILTIAFLIIGPRGAWHIHGLPPEAPPAAVTGGE